MTQTEFFTVQFDGETRWLMTLWRGRCYVWVPNLGAWYWNEGLQDDWQWEREGTYRPIHFRDVPQAMRESPLLDSDTWGWLLEEWRQGPSTAHPLDLLVIVQKSPLGARAARSTSVKLAGATPSSCSDPGDRVRLWPRVLTQARRARAQSVIDKPRITLTQGRREGRQKIGRLGLGVSYSEIPSGSARRAQRVAVAAIKKVPAIVVETKSTEAESAVPATIKVVTPGPKRRNAVTAKGATSRANVSAA